MTTIHQIFKLEGELSPAHVQQIRKILPLDATVDQYLEALKNEAELTRLAIEALQVQ